MNGNCKTDLLSEYIDNELESVTRQEVEEHLATCGECRAVVGELRNVVRRAGVFEDRVPQRDLWPAIAKRIGASSGVSASTTKVRRFGRRRRVSLSVPQMIAAGIAIVALVGSAGWLGASLGRGNDQPDVVAFDQPEMAMFATAPFETRYDDAIAQLLATIEREREWLHPNTVRIVEDNLLVIDEAIARAREALRQDPQSEYVRSHLESTVRKKLNLLRRVTEMASRS